MRLDLIRRGFGMMLGGVTATPARTSNLPTAITLTEPQLVQRLMLSASIGITLLIVWASYARLDDIARAGGIIVAHGNNAVVQHQNGGTIERIFIAEGQSVASGQPLVKLNDIDIEADFATIRQRMEFLAAQVRRLGYVLNLPQTVPSSGLSVTGTGQTTIMPPLTQLLPPPSLELADINDTDFLAAIEPAAGTEPPNDPQALALMERRRTLRNGVALAHQEYQRQLGLRKQGFSTQSRVYAAERDMQNQTQVLATFESELAAQYASAISEHQQQDEQLKKLYARAQNSTVRAPIAGTVQSLRINTAGATIPAGATLMELVPAGAQLEVLLRLSPSHVGEVRIGQTAHIRVTAFESTHYGTLKGTVSKISADTIADSQGSPMYQVWVSIPQTLEGARGTQAIKPGMIVVAAVVTGQHTVMDYLLRPIRNALDDLSPRPTTSG